MTEIIAQDGYDSQLSMTAILRLDPYPAKHQVAYILRKDSSIGIYACMDMKAELPLFRWGASSFVRDPALVYQIYWSAIGYVSQYPRHLEYLMPDQNGKISFVIPGTLLQGAEDLSSDDPRHIRHQIREHLGCLRQFEDFKGRSIKRYGELTKSIKGE